MGNEQTSLFPMEAKKSGCVVCCHFSALKDPHERSDGAIIYGYCFKDGDKNYSTNMGKGLAVFLPDGTCRQFKHRRKSAQRKEGQSKFAQDAGGILLHYIHEQRRLVHDIITGVDEPRKDIMYHHEADKLYMLESMAIDAGHDMRRTITYVRAEAEAALGGGGNG